MTRQDAIDWLEHAAPEMTLTWQQCRQIAQWLKGAEWRPIETAPRDTLVLVWKPTWRTRVNAAICVRGPYGPKWVLANDDSGYGIETPTHWMPIPAAPDTQQPPIAQEKIAS